LSGEGEHSKKYKETFHSKAEIQNFCSSPPIQCLNAGWQSIHWACCDNEMGAEVDSRRSFSSKIYEFVLRTQINITHANNSKGYNLHNAFIF
jgi:hypothetical protein